MGSVARTVMDDCCEKFLKLLKEKNVKVYLLKKYVDDILSRVKNLPLGSRWMDGQICVDEEARMKDLEAKKSPESVTMSVLGEIVSSINGDLKFTTKVTEGPEDPLPYLDAKI